MWPDRSKELEIKKRLADRVKTANVPAPAPIKKPKKPKK